MRNRYRDRLIKHARYMRKNPTLEESKLWRKLCKKQLAGLRFRRQHVLMPYIVDFYCPAKRMAVEIDGGVHWGNAHLDARRDRYLQDTYQISILRVQAVEVEIDVDHIFEQIRAAALA